MTKELTNSIQLLASNKMSGSFSPKNNFETEADVFSATLDKAAKSYVDKTENKVESDKDYAKNTKNIQTKNNTTDKECTKADNKPDSDVKEQNVTDEQSVQELQEAVQVQQAAKTLIDECAAAADESVALNAVGQDTKKNALANEQLLANIDYDTAGNESVIDEKTLKAILEKVKAAEGESLSQNAQAAVKTERNPAGDTTSDMSRITANIDRTEETTVVKAVTPTDTEVEKSPVIKVTEEVAAGVKENTAANLENKDTTSKIKDKAVAQMTSLEDTNTVVNDAQSTDSSNRNGSSLSQNNAQEQVAKMSVEANSADIANSQAAGSEVFVNKLDAQLSASNKTSSNIPNMLNQNSIMEQVNKQFEQMQQSGSNKVSIILQPENLGRVSVEIMNSKDGIVAKMLTDNQQVKDLFDKNVEALKLNLSSQGVNVNNIKIECTQQSSNNAMNFEQEQFNQSFGNPQHSNQNQTHQSNTQTQSYYGTEYDEFEDVEITGGTEIKNTETIIQHNGKVDYKV